MANAILIAENVAKKLALLVLNVLHALVSKILIANVIVIAKPVVKKLVFLVLNVVDIAKFVLPVLLVFVIIIIMFVMHAHRINNLFIPYC